jgi:hypothetical protein
MTHQTFKICVICDNNIENFYIKHFIDDFSPTWTSFTNKIYQRNPKLSKHPNLKIYWIDDENDEIIVSCEEDFRVYAEHGAHRKLYFTVKSEEVVEKSIEPEVVESEPQTASGSGLGSGKDNKDDETTETDDVNERKKRLSKKKEIKLKLRHEREKRSSKKDDDEARKLRQQQIEEEINRKILEKQQKYLERHQKRCEKVRRMFQTVMDPANLTSTVSNEDVPPTTTAPPTPGTTSAANSTDNSQIYPHSDQIKQLTAAIANVLQPCNLINKILGEVIGNLIPVPQGSHQAQPAATTTITTTSTATNTQNPETTPATPVNSDESGPTSSHLGMTVAQNEDLIRKITESCNEIINSQNLVQNALQNLQQQSSTSNVQEELTQSVSQAVLQNEEVIKKISESTNNLIDSQNIVKNILESMNGSQNTVLTTSSSDSANTQIEMEIVPVPGEMNNVNDDKVDEESIIIVSRTPTSLRSRESSIEVQEFISNSDDGDREWTFVSTGDSFSKSDSPKGKYTGTIPKGISLAESSEDEMDEIPVPVEKSVQPEPQKMDVEEKPAVVATSSTAIVTDSASFLQAERATTTTATTSLANLNASRVSVSSQVEAQTQATSATQTQTPTAPEAGPGAVGPAVIVYDSNPKINRSIHAMVEMGYSNEGNWLTQLMINVDGDVSKALAFLTPNK